MKYVKRLAVEYAEGTDKNSVDSIKAFEAGFIKAVEEIALFLDRNTNEGLGSSIRRIFKNKDE